MQGLILPALQLFSAFGGWLFVLAGAGLGLWALFPNCTQRVGTGSASLGTPMSEWRPPINDCHNILSSWTVRSWNPADPNSETWFAVGIIVGALLGMVAALLVAELFPKSKDFLGIKG
jgi:hypothetical protein